ncbi:MAG: AI-2E family transporter [Oscillospiraceae bacterium]
MKVDFNKKYTTIAVYTVITFAVCLLLVVLVKESEKISAGLKTVAKVLAPVTWGVVIAYILNPVMMWSEKCLKKLLEKKKERPKLVRSLSVFLSMILLIAILIAFVAILIPQIVDSIVGIAGNFSTYLSNFEKWIYKFVEDYPDIYNFVQDQFNSIQPKINEFVNNLIPQLANIAVKLKDGAIGLIGGLKDFVIGFIVAIYLLFSKEKFIAQARKMISAIFPKYFAQGVFNVASHANKTLGGFISGKILDSTIIGIITFICMTIMKMDFVALISVVIGVTNIIPFFGPFIGAIPSAVLLLVAAPRQVIPFVVFIIILQQFDGNILGPKILGDSTGLSPFWVMFAIFVGGGLFGFAGMLLGVPVFAVIYSMISDFVNFLLRRKGMSADTGDYYAPAAETSPSSKREFVNKPVSEIFKSRKKKQDGETEAAVNDNKDDSEK